MRHESPGLGLDDAMIRMLFGTGPKQIQKHTPSPDATHSWDIGRWGRHWLSTRPGVALLQAQGWEAGRGEWEEMSHLGVAGNWLPALLFRSRRAFSDFLYTNDRQHHPKVGTGLLLRQDTTRLTRLSSHLPARIKLSRVIGSVVPSAS